MIKNNVNSKCNVCLKKKKQNRSVMMSMCSTLIRPLDHWSSEQMSACTALLISLSPQTHTFCSQLLVPASYFYILFFLSPCSLFVYPLFTPHHNHFSFHFPSVKPNTPPDPCTPCYISFSLRSGFLFLSQRLQQESHGCPLQADALQFVLQLVLQASEPHRRVNQNHCEEATERAHKLPKQLI